MRKNKIYTIGGNDMVWRKKVEEYCSQYDDIISIVNPRLHSLKFTDKEFIEWNKQQIYNSDIALVNIPYINTEDIFTLGIIESINSFTNKHIFVITFGDEEVKFNPHIDFTIFHHETNYEDALDYIQNLLSVS